MNPTQNQALKALPNVLHDQTVPNTLSGIGPPAAAVRRRTPAGTSVAAAAVVLAVLLAMLSRAA